MLSLLQVETYRALIDSESEEEKQNKETENNISVTPEETSESKNTKKKFAKKRKVGFIALEHIFF